jgi:tetratricopeptide (TPR) repeat protein
VPVSKNRRKKKSRTSPSEKARKAAAIDALLSPMPDGLTFEDLLAKIAGEFAPSGGDDDEDEDPLWRAQQLMYDAWELRNKRARIALARKALEISDRCADAYVLLAEEAARDILDQRLLYEQGVAAGERAIGPETFEEGAGNFWLILETRPYMRARTGLASTLWQLGERDAAIGHMRDMLRLNPNDNQGLRYVLACWLFTVSDLAGVEALLADFPDDMFAESAWARVLLEFRRAGRSTAAESALRNAWDVNPFVPGLLTGAIGLSKSLPDYYSLGSKEEAAIYVAANRENWSATAGALQWLAEASRNRTPAGKRR